MPRPPAPAGWLPKQDWPYPEHGVGWEAGYRVAYFANRRIVAQTPSWPADVSLLIADIEMSSAVAVLVWGKPADPSFQRVLRSLAAEYQTSLAIVDPALGQVGAVVAGRIAGNQVAAADSPVSHIGGRWKQPRAGRSCFQR